MLWSIFYCTSDWLFFDVTLLIVGLARLADVVVSGEVNWDTTPATPVYVLAVKLALPLDCQVYFLKYSTTTI